MQVNNTNGATLEAVRRERAARANSETPATDRTRVLNSLARSAPVRSLARACSFAAFGVLLVALGLVATATLPGLFGYHTYTIDGGSMEPTLSVGDAAVTKPSSPRSLEVGDVIVRRDTRGGQPVLHRIVEIVSVDGQLAFITQGDKNNAPDVQPVVLAGTGDKVIYSVPYAGYLLNFGTSTLGHILLLGAPLALLAAISLYEKLPLRRKHVQQESLQQFAQTPRPTGGLTLVPQRLLFQPASKPMRLSLIDISDFRRLMNAVRTLSDFPAAKRASLIGFKHGCAVLEVALRVPLHAGEIADELQGGTGYHILIEEARPDMQRLRLRFIEPAAQRPFAHAA